MTKLPPLAAPGAGIPTFQRLASRYWLLPRYYKRTSWDAAQSFFDKEGLKILELARSLKPDELGRRELVDPRPGLEDSSRFWSVAMTLEHLVIVGEGMRQAIEALGHGRTIHAEADTAKMKPKGTTDGEVRDPSLAAGEFEAFLKRFRETAMSTSLDRGSRARFKHPWFGAMTAHEWHCLASLHQNLHRRQAADIVGRIRGQAH